MMGVMGNKEGGLIKRKDDGSNGKQGGGID